MYRFEVFVVKNNEKFQSPFKIKDVREINALLYLSSVNNTHLHTLHQVCLLAHVPGNSVKFKLYFRKDSWIWLKRDDGALTLSLADFFYASFRHSLLIILIIYSAVFVNQYLRPY